MNACSTRYRICPLQVVGFAMLLGLLIISCQENREEQEDVPSAATSTATSAQLDPTAEPEEATATATATIPDESDEAADGTPELGPNGHYAEVRVADDGTKHLIPLDEIFAGGPAKDGIPSIDAPQFVGPDEWDELEYRDDGLVIGIEVDGLRRAYPFQVLVWHELVNDTVGEIPLLISYCPLCGTGIVFERRIDGEPVEFGVSGQLYNSDLLMYDRHSDTLWSQITGTAVVGDLTGQRLPFYPSEIMTWGDWRATYPESEVLSRDTGHDRNYDADPYGDYYVDGSIWFPVAGLDARLSSKTRVTGVEIDEETFGAYPDEAVREHGPVNDTLGSEPLLIVADPSSGENIVVLERRLDDGRVLSFELDGDVLVDVETGTQWSFKGEGLDGPLAGTQLRQIETVKGFWFAWFAFHPETALWQPE